MTTTAPRPDDTGQPDARAPRLERRAGETDDRPATVRRYAAEVRFVLEAWGTAGLEQETDGRKRAAAARSARGALQYSGRNWDGALEHWDGYGDELDLKAIGAAGADEEARAVLTALERGNARRAIEAALDVVSVLPLASSAAGTAADIAGDLSRTIATDEAFRREAIDALLEHRRTTRGRKLNPPR